jgi:hypothetical protein
MNAGFKNIDSELVLVLQAHFKGELNLSRVKLICLFMYSL